MKIVKYNEKFKNDVMRLILHIQNNEAKINLTLQEQPDLADINKYYTEKGGAFWLAVEENAVIGTVGLIVAGHGYGILKKFFVKAEFRGKGVGLALYSELLHFAKQINLSHILLDTPSVAAKSHIFYERAGFKRIDKGGLPINYEYPDRNSFLYMLDLRLTIRQYEEDDCRILSDLFYETVHSVNAKDYTEEQLFAWVKDKNRLITRRSDLSEKKTLIAEIDGKTVGFGSIDKSGYLDLLFVHKGYQGQGIATALCDELEKDFCLIITNASVTAKPFFEKRGFVTEKEQEVVRSGIKLKNYRMKKVCEERLDKNKI